LNKSRGNEELGIGGSEFPIDCWNTAGEKSTVYMGTLRILNIASDINIYLLRSTQIMQTSIKQESLANAKVSARQAPPGES